MPTETSRFSPDAPPTAGIPDGAYPLSPMQDGLLFHALLAPGSDAYIYRLRARLHGPLRADAFVDAWRQVIDRHSILRTRFIWDGLKHPVQSVVADVAFRLQHLDWCGLSPATQSERRADLLSADRKEGFDLSRPPLMRAALVRLSESDYEFIWTHHHLILDGWSISVVLADVAAAYARGCTGSMSARLEPARPYRDYIEWLQRQDHTAAERFWRRTFTPPAHVAPVKLVDQARASDQSYELEAARLHRRATSSLHALAREHQLTLSTLLHGVWAILLARYSGIDEVVFGTVVSGRPATLAGVDSMAGLFINTLPIRVQLRPAEWLLHWLRELQLKAAEVREHQYTPLTDIQTYASCPAGHSLFDSVVSFDNYPVHGLVRQRLGNVQIDDIHDENRSHYAVALKCVPGDELALTLSFDPGRLYGSTAKAILTDVVRVLTRISLQSQIRLSELMSPSASEAGSRARPSALNAFDELFALD